jgi:hypothetical protein
MTRRLRTIGFLALVLASACDQQDCEERLLAAAAVGGPIGLLVAKAASCAAEVAENTAAASPRAYIAAAPTPAPKPAPEPMPAPIPAPMPVTPPPPPVDSDGDGVPDSADQCRTLAAGATPSTSRPGCPAPITIVAALPQPQLSGNIAADGDGYAVTAGYDWKAQQPGDGTLSYRFPMPAMTAQAQQVQVFYDISADLTWGTETAKCAAALGYPGYFVASPSGRPTDFACVRPAVIAPNYTSASELRLGGPGTSGIGIPVSTQTYTLAVRFRGDVAVTQPEGTVTLRIIF